MMSTCPTWNNSIFSFTSTGVFNWGQEEMGDCFLFPFLPQTQLIGQVHKIIPESQLNQNRNFTIVLNFGSIFLILRFMGRGTRAPDSVVWFWGWGWFPFLFPSSPPPTPKPQKKSKAQKMNEGAFRGRGGCLERIADCYIILHKRFRH